MSKWGRFLAASLVICVAGTAPVSAQVTLTSFQFGSVSAAVNSSISLSSMISGGTALWSLGASCSSCVQVTNPSGFSAVNYGFSLGGSPGPAMNGASPLPNAPGIDEETFNGLGQLSVTGGSNGLLAFANFSTYSVYASPNSNAPVTFEIDLFSLTFNGNNYIGPFYLDITGTPTSPVTLTTVPNTSMVVFTTPLTIDWSASLSTTPLSAVPLPPSVCLLIGALGGLGIITRKRKT